MGKYKGYEKYKDSGVEWLGAIPEHWKAVRLKHITNKIIDGAHFTPTYVNEGIPFLRVTDIVQAKNNSINMNNIKFIPEEEHNTLSLRCKPEKGDLLYSKNGTIGVPRIVDWDFDFSIFVSLCLIKVIKPKVNIEFLQYSLLGKLTETQINIGAKSNTVTNLHLDKIKEFWATLPPLNEQKTIAQFLDYKTKQIDDLIKKKETLIEKLNEKRTALISHAVIKGLEPNVPMKDSGVEWLGKIPEHWSINKLGRLTEEINDINHEMPVAVDQGIPFLSAKDLLDDGTLNFEKDIKKISEEDFIRLSKKICPKRNDIIYSRIGACLGKARIVEVDIKFLVSYSCCVIRLRQELANPIFFKYFLDSELVLSEARLRTQGIGVPDLGLKQISKFATSVPPILEQIEIARFLDYKTKQIDDLIAKKEALIEKLDEKRTAPKNHRNRPTKSQN